uniref:Uncharacterized protein n=1 Tax=Schistocephalus solidus TaxID=70667 RepID=A0A0V0J6M0_SCHSO
MFWSENSPKLYLFVLPCNHYSHIGVFNKRSRTPAVNIQWHFGSSYYYPYQMGQTAPNAGPTAWSLNIMKSNVGWLIKQPRSDVHWIVVTQLAEARRKSLQFVRTSGQSD